jgi:hypothetical protein
METFATLFGSLLALVYHCFDRIVILGHLPLLTRPENIVHFFRDIHRVSTISKEVLRQRTDDYHRWVEAFAKKRKIPLEWAVKIPGIKIQDTRMLRLMEVLLHPGTQLGGWRSRHIHQAILSTFQLTPESYTLTQLRYDLRIPLCATASSPSSPPSRLST